MERLPDFVVLGAMKSATTTLHAQLARQPGLFLSDPKEPNFFSDDPVWARGVRWYGSLFAAAPSGAICGESSTHYTKRPKHPGVVERMLAVLPAPKLIYVMRHPIDRLLSHHAHERTVGRAEAMGALEEAVDRIPELVDYGRYAWQIEPFLKAYGPDRILPVFFGRLVSHPQAELERIGRFLGASETLRWDFSLPPQNVGTDRLRPSRIREAVVTSSVLTPIRKSLVPRAIADPIKRFWRSNQQHSPLSPALRRRLEALFDPDLEQLGARLGIVLNCQTFDAATSSTPLTWRKP